MTPIKQVVIDWMMLPNWSKGTADEIKFKFLRWEDYSEFLWWIWLILMVLKQKEDGRRVRKKDVMSEAEEKKPCKWGHKPRD